MVAVAKPPVKKAVQSAKKIASVKKAVPATKKAVAKKTMSPPTRGGKPKAVKDLGRPGPMGPRNGSGSIPFQGPGPSGQGVY